MIQIMPQVDGLVSGLFPHCHGLSRDLPRNTSGVRVTVRHDGRSRTFMYGLSNTTGRYCLDLPLTTGRDPVDYEVLVEYLDSAGKVIDSSESTVTEIGINHIPADGVRVQDSMYVRLLLGRDIGLDVYSDEGKPVTIFSNGHSPTVKEAMFLLRPIYAAIRNFEVLEAPEVGGGLVEARNMLDVVESMAGTPIELAMLFAHLAAASNLTPVILWGEGRVYAGVEVSSTRASFDEYALISSVDLSCHDTVIISRTSKCILLDMTTDNQCLEDSIIKGIGFGGMSSCSTEVEGARIRAFKNMFRRVEAIEL